MKALVTVSALTFIVMAGINWIWGIAVIFVWFFMELVQFLFSPK